MRNLSLSENRLPKALNKVKEIYDLVMLESKHNDFEHILQLAIKFHAPNFQDVFLKDHPLGSPLLKGIKHQIGLVPGAPLSNKATLRYNPQVP